MTPITNTHVHVPPNFSAFATPGEAVEAARAEKVRVLGVSNFYDQQVYSMIRDLAEGCGVLPEYGLEFITFVPDLEARAIRINDPANPGRMYLTGKGIDPFRPPTPRAAETARRIRDGNDSRARLMVEKVSACFASAGFDAGVDADGIIAQVAARAQVPAQWVSLQERHIAKAFQEGLDRVPPGQRIDILTRVYGSASEEGGDPAFGRMTNGDGRMTNGDGGMARGSGGMMYRGGGMARGSGGMMYRGGGMARGNSGVTHGSGGMAAPPRADPGDPAAVQAEIRSRLLKAGAPGFVPEVPLSFEDAYSSILDMGGIPCYPILADGCDPMCPFETSPHALAEELLGRGIHAAELIPNRNHRDVVDEYVRVLVGAGLIVMAGTEHNTADRIPLDPTCVDGPPSSAARRAFFEATCVVVAHAERARHGRTGYVDSAGGLAQDPDGVQNLVREGETLVAGAS